MNILFATSAAPARSPFFTEEKMPPLGMGTLMSLARGAHKVFFVDNYLSPSGFLEDGFLLREGIGLVAIHANTVCYRDTLRMLDALQKMREKGAWKGKIAVGGPHASVAVETIPDFVDHVVQGEGERAIGGIIDGSAIRRVIRTERIEDLDSLPFEPWDIFARLPYDFSCDWLDVAPVFPMNTSRGCPFGCSFCSVGSVWGGRHARASAERVVSEIEYLVKDFGARGIYFREDDFTLDARRTDEFCRSLTKRRLGIQWACESRVDALCDEDVVEALGSAGCRAVYLGVESGSQRMLDLLNKGITVGQIERAVLLCRKHDIRVYCSLIAGVPGETYRDYTATRRLMERLKPYRHAFNVFVGIPGSPLYGLMKENGLYEHKDDLGLLYPPGYGIKARFFYGRDRREAACRRSSSRTGYDKALMRRLCARELREETLAVRPPDHAGLLR